MGTADGSIKLSKHAPLTLNVAAGRGRTGGGFCLVGRKALPSLWKMLVLLVGSGRMAFSAHCISSCIF